MKEKISQFQGSVGKQTPIEGATLNRIMRRILWKINTVNSVLKSCLKGLQ